MGGDMRGAPGGGNMGMGGGNMNMGMGSGMNMGMGGGMNMGSTNMGGTGSMGMGASGISPQILQQLNIDPGNVTSQVFIANVSRTFFTHEHIVKECHVCRCIRA